MSIDDVRLAELAVIAAARELAAKWRRTDGPVIERIRESVAALDRLKGDGDSS